MLKGVLLAAVLAAMPARAAAHATVIALPERTTVVHAGDVVLVPLYDSRGDVTESGSALRKIGIRAIAPRDLRRDIMAANHLTPAGQIPNATGDRAEAFVAVHPGKASTSIVLSLPQYRQRCVSCRTLHYFFDIRPDSTAHTTLITTREG